MEQGQKLPQVLNMLKMCFVTQYFSHSLYPFQKIFLPLPCHTTKKPYYYEIKTFISL